MRDDAGCKRRDYGRREGGRDGQSSMYTSRRVASHHTGHGRTADVNSDGHDAIAADGLAEEDLLDYCITIYNVLLLMLDISLATMKGFCGILTPSW